MKQMLSRKATAYGGRDGQISDMDSGLSLNMTKPLEMGGTSNKGTNPEELFSAGYAACFASSLEYLLQSNQVSYDDIKVEAETKLMMVPNEGFKFQLVVAVKIKGVDDKTKNVYVEKARNFCPYSKAIKGNVDISFI